jgi:hypothetical protein
MVGLRAIGEEGVQSHDKHPEFILRICNAVITPPMAVTALITMAATLTGSDIIILKILL